MFLDQFLCTNQVRNCIQNYCDKCTPKFGVDPFIANSSKLISVQGVVLKMKMKMKLERTNGDKFSHIKLFQKLKLPKSE